MGEKTSTLFPITFNPSLTVETRPERLSSDGGTIILREIDQRLQITYNLAKNLHDPRDPNTIIHPLIELLRTRLYLIIQGWKDADDADKLRNDPALLTAISARKGQAPLKPETASKYPQCSRLTTHTLQTDRNPVRPPQPQNPPQKSGQSRPRLHPRTKIPSLSTLHHRY